MVRTTAPGGRRPRAHTGLLAGLVLVATVLVALDVDVPVLRPLLALALLVVLPTVVVFQRAELLGDVPLARLAYAGGLVLGGLIVGALVVNTLLPLVGVDRPLQPVVLAVVAGVVDLALLAWRRHRPLGLGARWPRGSHAWRALLGARLEAAQALATVGLLLAVVGAIRLNNGASGLVAVTAQVVAAAALVVLLAGRSSSTGRDARVLTLVSLGLLLATSLRGWTVTGHDVQTEYLVFTLTNDAQRWSMDAFQNAYNACLSVNLLPTVLTQTTGLSGPFVFKVVLQVVFAVLPVLTYLFARRFLSRRLALVAAVVTLAFPTFSVDMPFLVRQEIAYLFVALLLLAGTATGARRKDRLRLMTFLGVGVVLSHYSTTYLLLLGLVAGLGVLVLLRGVRRLRHRSAEATGERLTLLSPVLIAFLIAVSLLWTGPATHTGGYASEVASATLKALRGQGGDGPGASVVSFNPFSGSVSTRERLDLYVEQTLQDRKAVPADQLLVPRLTPADLKPRIVPSDDLPVTAAGRAVEAVGLDLGTVSGLLRTGAAGLVVLLLALGVLWLLRRRRSSGRVPDEIAALSVGAAAGLALIVLVPNLSVDYGVLRALQQTLMLTAPAVAVGLSILVGVLPRWRVGLTALVPAALLLALTGALAAMLGGSPGQLALSTSGPYVERYYATDSEVTTIERLAQIGRASPEPPTVIADANLAIRTAAVTTYDANVVSRLYPTLLTRGAYVFVDAGLAATGRAAVFASGDLINYVYPLWQLDAPTRRRLHLG